MDTNSNRVLRFYGEGAVTNMLLKPSLIATARDKPIAADLPRPRLAVNDTVVLHVLSANTSISVISTFA